LFVDGVGLVEEGVEAQLQVLHMRLKELGLLLEELVVLHFSGEVLVDLFVEGERGELRELARLRALRRLLLHRDGVDAVDVTRHIQVVYIIIIKKSDLSSSKCDSRIELVLDETLLVVQRHSF